MGKLYENDVGVEIRVDVGISLSGATLKQLRIQKPDGSVLTKTAAIDTDDTILTYTTVASDLSEPGEYRVQAYIEWGASSKHLGETAVFRIFNIYR